jgi:hypothetical protein
MGRPNLTNADFSPGQRVKNTMTGEFGVVAKDKRMNNTWLVIVHKLRSTRSVSDKTTTWKVKQIEVA